MRSLGYYWTWRPKITPFSWLDDVGGSPWSPPQNWRNHRKPLSFRSFFDVLTHPPGPWPRKHLLEGDLHQHGARGHWVSPSLLVDHGGGFDPQLQCDLTALWCPCDSRISTMVWSYGARAIYNEVHIVSLIITDRLQTDWQVYWWDYQNSVLSRRKALV